VAGIKQKALDADKKLGLGTQSADNYVWRIRNRDVWRERKRAGGEGDPKRFAQTGEGLTMLLVLIAVFVVDIFWWIRR
jgi:hypothetical protein